MDDDENHSFVFINCMLMKVLKPIDIIVQQLQSVNKNFISALEVINSVKEEIKSERETVTKEKAKKMVDDFSKVQGPQRPMDSNVDLEETRQFFSF